MNANFSTKGLAAASGAANKLELTLNQRTVFAFN